VPVSSEHPIGDDQEEPVYEEDNQFVEKGKWISPLWIFFLNLYNCMFTQCLFLLVAMHEIDWKSPF
jgi:hypothetical protein